MIFLKEYQVKKLFAQNRIRIPQSVLVRQDKVAPKRLPWKGDTAVKAQVPFSSRLKKKLVVLLRDQKKIPGELIVIRKRMKRFGRADEILLEERVPCSGAQFYLSIASEPAARGPVFLFDAQGGSGIEERAETSMQAKLLIDYSEGLKDFELQALFFRCGISDRRVVRQLTQIALKLYELYRRWNAQFIEINPLAVTPEGLVALDGKMQLDEDAVFRLGEKDIRFIENVEGRAETPLEKAASEIDAFDYRGACHFVQTDIDAVRAKFGSQIKSFVGFDGVGTGVSLAAMDELVRLGFYPRNFCDTSGNPPASKLYRVTKIILSQKDIGGYFFISCMSSQQLHHTARGIIKAFREIYADRGGVPDLPALLVFRGAWDEEAKALFEEHGLLKSKHVRVVGREYSERKAAALFDRMMTEFHS